jgi:hypothetical protein
MAIKASALTAPVGASASGGLTLTTLMLEGATHGGEQGVR